MTTPRDSLAGAERALEEADALTRQHTERRTPARRVSDVPPDYVSVTEYAQRQSVNRKTVAKWMRYGLVDFYRVMLPGESKALIRVKNIPPRAAAEKKEHDMCPSQSVLDATR